MVKKLNKKIKKNIVPWRHGIIVFNLIFLFNFFTIILLLLYFFSIVHKEPQT